MQVTYYGQSCFMFETNGHQILFDPFITPNELASHIDVDSINPDFILVSHGHQDHVADLIPIAKKSQALVVGSFELTTWLNNNGIENTHPMNIGGKWQFDFGTVKMVNAVHSNSLPDGTYGGTEAGYVIQAEGKSIYYAGDTALHYDMKLLRELFEINAAFLPIGDNFTMGVDDAIVAAEFIGCSNIVGMHYDTFGYIKIDHEEAKQKFAKAGLNLTLMPIGDSITL
ncbi:MAG TPA: metal-dependent hydrolase [Sphingobacteriaceae bacterium]